MTSKYLLRARRLSVCLFLGAVLAACGGGGGGSANSGGDTPAAASPGAAGTGSTGGAVTGSGEGGAATGSSGGTTGTGTTTGGTTAAAGSGGSTGTTAPAMPGGTGEFVLPGTGANSGTASASAGGATTVAVQGGGSTAPASSDPAAPGSSGGTGSTGSTGATTGTATSGTGTTAGGSGSTGTTTGTNSTPTSVASTPPQPESSGLQGTGPRTLVLYDAPAGSEYEKLGKSYAIMLRNLLGHFDARVDLVPVQLYAAGQLAQYDAGFYVGAIYNNPLPATLLVDVAAASKPFVWFKYNLWALAGDPALGFTGKSGIAFTGLRGLNALPSASNPKPGFFDTVRYKGLDFVKYYAWDGARNVISADPDLGITAVADASRASVVVPVSNPATGEQAPYVIRSGNFWYVADMPFSYIGPRDRYLVIADLLHDMLGIQHAESHKAMVRLEDVDAKVSPAAMKTLSDYLQSKSIRFSIAAIPHYKDPFGAANGGVAEDIPLAQANTLRQALDYAIQRGAEIVMHGYTHQYGTMKNPWTGVSGDDYEFWDIVANAPVPEDSTPWALGRLNAGVTELVGAGYTPVAWETPHYVASPLTSKAVPQVFPTTYQRVVYFTGDKPDFTARPGKDFSAGQIFPYIVQRDYYGQRVLPENLGNIEYDIHQKDPTSFLTYTWQDIALNAKYALAVRDGFGSFFFHPFWLEPDVGTPGLSDFKQLVEAISALGYTWVTPSQLR